MRSFVKSLFVGAVALGLLSASSSHAFRIAPVPKGQPVQAALQADVIVTGKVVGIEKETVEVAAFRGARKDDPKDTYKIAKVKISDALSGAKGLTEIKVGFSTTGGGGGGPFTRTTTLPFVPRAAITLTEGQEGVFALVRHFEGDFYVLAGGYNAGILEKKAATYDKDLAQIKKNLTIIKDPITALKSKEKEDRFTALIVLGTRYRQWGKGTPSTEEAIPAEEANLILDVMLEMPWAPKAGEANPDFSRTLSNVFNTWLFNEQNRLKFQYPKAKPGDTQETISKMYEEAITKFIKDNREKLVLKRYVEKK